MTANYPPGVTLMGTLVTGRLTVIVEAGGTEITEIVDTNDPMPLSEFVAWTLMLKGERVVSMSVEQWEILEFSPEKAVLRVRRKS